MKPGPITALMACVACLAPLTGGCTPGDAASAPAPPVAAHEAREEVLALISTFLASARRHDRAALLSTLSRRHLEAALRPLLAADAGDDLVRRRILALRNHGVFANHCAGRLQALGEADGILLAEVHVRFSEATMPVRFELVEEGGQWRIDGIREQPSQPGVQSDVDFDVCDVPINWNNPALLKDGETAEAQQARLGIP